MAAGLPAQALQFRGNHAEAGGAQAAEMTRPHVDTFLSHSISMTCAFLLTTFQPFGATISRANWAKWARLIRVIPEREAMLRT
jgi:hypothetical protein